MKISLGHSLGGLTCFSAGLLQVPGCGGQGGGEVSSSGGGRGGRGGASPLADGGRAVHSSAGGAGGGIPMEHRGHGGPPPPAHAPPPETKSAQHHQVRSCAGRVADGGREVQRADTSALESPDGPGQLSECWALSGLAVREAACAVCPSLFAWLVPRAALPEGPHQPSGWRSWGCGGARGRSDCQESPRALLPCRFCPAILLHLSVPISFTRDASFALVPGHPLLVLGHCGRTGCRAGNHRAGCGRPASGCRCLGGIPRSEEIGVWQMPSIAAGGSAVPSPTQQILSGPDWILLLAGKAFRSTMITSARVTGRSSASRSAA